MFCPWCGGPLPPLTGKRGRPRKYCTDECTRRANRVGRSPDSPSRTCTKGDCARPVRARDLCNMHLRRAYRAEGREKAPEWGERRRANWKKRYALTRGAPVGESFTYRDIFERDGWTCGICAAVVDPGLAWPDPMSASLDHILPVSRGGAHTPENAQLAHLVCNVRKGDAAA